nr:aldo/keto reductase [Jiangella aurantiaca]
MNRSAMLARFVQETDVDVVMCAGRYTLLEQGALYDLLPAAQAEGVGVVIAGVYNSGLLASERPPTTATYDYEQAPPKVIERAHRIAAACEDWGVTLPEAALAFARAHPAVISTVVGVRDAAQVAATLRRSEADVPPGLWADLRERGVLQTDL